MKCPSCQTVVDASQRFCPACGTALARFVDPTQPPADPLVGQTLGGKYRVTRKLGEGGMGAVYEGEQPLGLAKRKVAIKTLHPHLSQDPKIQARFEREVATIAELEHPNTIQVYDFGATGDGILYIVMEFLHGANLAERLTHDGPMEPARSARVLEQVCGSLEEAHGRGIVHRDLKPENIFLVERAGQRDFVKVLDFGIAKRAREHDPNEQKLTQQGMVLGTPPYMSPEQFTGEPIDARSDIYSLGIVAYEMLTGKLPFKANTAWEWATQHMTQPPIPIESLADSGRIPAAMRGAVQRALAKRPDDRFQSVREFIDAFSGRSAANPALDGSRLAPSPLRTEFSAPLDLVAAFGAGSKASGGAPAAAAYTPPAGNMAMPAADAARPMPSTESAVHGGNRTTLLAVAGVIAAASILAIVFAMRGGSPAPREVVLDNGPSSAPTLSVEPTPIAPVDTPVLAVSTSAAVPPLSGGSPAALKPQGHPSIHPGGVPSAFASAIAGAIAAAPAHTEPTPSPPASAAAMPTPPFPPASVAAPTPAPPGRYDGPECQKARLLRTFGRIREAQSWTLACLAKGGSL